jgi:hypothetical protein
MERLYAIVNNNKVTDVKNLSDEYFAIEIKHNQLIVDVSEMVTTPGIGWKLDGNQLIPGDEATEYTDSMPEMLKMNNRFKFGNQLCDEMVKLLSIRNLELGKTSQQVSTMISTFLPIEMALRKCAIPTALGGIMMMAPAFPEYTDQFNYAIGKITTFLATEQ